jgi:glucokinase
MADHVIGIDLGGTKIAAGVVDERGTIVTQQTRPTDRTSADAVLGEMIAIAKALRAEAPEVRAIGIGIPGTLDQKRGMLVQAVNLPLSDVPIVQRMQDAVGLPVAVDNDANVAAFAEQRHGAAAGSSHALMVTLGTGVGGGIIIDGKISRGPTGAGAELGHVVINFDGPPCPGTCKNRGCVEVYCSGTAVARLARERGLPETSAPAVVRRALEGDHDARALLTFVGECLGVALSSFANIFEPEVIVVGGGLAAAAGEILLPVASEFVHAKALRPMNRVRIVAARFQNEAGVIGAAELARVELTPAA